ncbi:MAG: putative endonuclease [Bacteroidia bacterium]|jgi:putative endonuclease
MKTAQQHLGQKGEDIAINFLKQKGLSILFRNYRIGRAEIDIIAESSEWLLFIEVKTRSSLKYGYPESFVSKKQENMLFDASEAYCVKHQSTKHIRFDIIAILIVDKRINIMHFEDAFWPMG